MTIVGCDLHTRKQQVAVLHTDTGEVVEQELLHSGDAVEQFYRALPRPVTVGIESTGYALWFHELMQRLGHTLLVGEAAKIRAMVVRKTKTDRRDAQHLLDLLKHERFPAVWIPDPATRDLRALVTHRVRLVRIRTMVKNGLQAIALNRRLALGSKLWSQRGRAQLTALDLPRPTALRREESLELLTWLETHIDGLDARILDAAHAHPGARLLLTHPGVGALTALTTVLVLGPPARFPGSKHVVSYVGLAPAVKASADTCHLGQITRRAARVRWVLGQAAPSPPARMTISPSLSHLIHRRGRPKARVAGAQAALRLFMMVRDQIDYAEFRRRGRLPPRQDLHPRPA
jgi:transposase